MKRYLFALINFQNYICSVVSEPYEILCTSETTFKVKTCEGNDPWECEKAGGKFNEKTFECLDIDTETSTACDAILGFVYSVSNSTCGEFEYSILALYQDCSYPSAVYHIQKYKSNCCGGTDYYRDYCGDLLEPYEAFCTSESAFKTDSPVFYTCDGTDAEACTKAGGNFDDDSNVCDGIDIITSTACDAIGFTYTAVATCGEFVSEINNPEINFIDCYSPQMPLLLDQYQSTCCGSIDYYKDVCPDLKPDTPDICRECDVPSTFYDECFDLANEWFLLQGSVPDDVRAECAETESASDVFANCKDAIVKHFNCDESSSPSITVIPSLFLALFLGIIVIDRW